MVNKKFLMYLAGSEVSTEAFEEVRKYVPAGAAGYLIDILTFEGIFKKHPMNEELDLENSRLRLEYLGDQLTIDPSRQFVTIGDPGPKLDSCIKNFRIDILLISENLLANLNESSIGNIRKLGCEIIKIKNL